MGVRKVASAVLPDTPEGNALSRIGTAWKYRRTLWKYRKPLWSLYRHQRSLLLAAGAAAGFFGAAMMNRALGRG